MAVNNYIDEQIDNFELEALIEQYKYGRYFEDHSLPEESSRRFMLDHVRKCLSQDDSRYVVSRSSSGQLLGLLLYMLSPWDTEHFGYNVVIIDLVIIMELEYDEKLEVACHLLEKFHIWCDANGIRFISVKIPALDFPVIHALESYGFHYMESWIFNKYDLDRLDESEKTLYQLRLTRPTDVEIMLDYSKGAFANQRFHADPHISLSKADSLYEKWILTASSDPGQKILVLDVDDKPTAFMIYYKLDLTNYFNLRFAMWKMALIDPTNRGAGVGTNFFIALLHYHREEGLDVVDSGLSMRNLVSLKLHNKLNFQIVSTIVTFHKWLK